MSKLKTLGTWRSVRWVLLLLACAVGAISAPAPAGATDYCCLYVTQVEYYTGNWEPVGWCTYNVDCTNGYVCTGQITPTYRVISSTCCPYCSD